MSVASRKKLLTELKNKKYRDAYAAEHVKTMIPIQTRILREQRELSQGELAERMETTQSVISRHEDPNYGKLSLNSLLRLASAFDVALLVKFVPFTRLLREFEDVSPHALSAKEFIEDLPQLERWASHDSQSTIQGSQVYITAITTASSDVDIAVTIEGNKQLEDIPTGRDSFITAIRPQTMGTHTRAPQFFMQTDTTRKGALDGAA